jgi:hypothetical protein
MKKLKRLSVIIITIVLTTMSFSNAFAATSSSSEKYGGVTVYNNNNDPQTPTEGSYEEPTNRVFVTEGFAKSQQNNTITPRFENNVIKPLYGESGVSHVKATEYYTKTTTPDGQPTGGVRFGSGGGFYVNLNGGIDLGFQLEQVGVRFIIVSV